MFKNATRVPPAVYGQAVTHTAPSRAGMVQPLLWQPPEPQSRPTAVESMSSRAALSQFRHCDTALLELHRHLEHRAHLARDNGDTTPYGDSPLATSSFRVFHARRMSNAIVVADSRAVERYLGLQSTRQVGAPDALHPIDERAGY